MLRSHRGFTLRSRSGGGLPPRGKPKKNEVNKKMGKYKGKWNILIGFKAEQLKEISPIIEKLKEDFPEQEWNCLNSKFPQYDFILCGFAEDRDKAHQIGLAVVRKHLPAHLNLFYWVKEINLLKYNVRGNDKLKSAKTPS